MANANFLQLNFKNAYTGAAINTIYFTGDEIPLGVKRNEDADIVAQITTMGRARTFPKTVGIVFACEIILAASETVSKLDLIQTYISLGYIVDVKVLTGGMVYSSGTDNLAYSVSKATVLNMSITAFDNSWRQMMAVGQKSRVTIPIEFREGASFSLPIAAQWVGN